MGEREWKPGDDIPDGAYTVSFTWNNTAIKVLLRILRDGYPSGYTSMAEHVRRAIDARPLVVIDPEDSGAVSRLQSVLDKWGYTFTTTPPQFDLRRDDNCLSAALREFANPKPPPCGASLTLGSDGAMYRCAEPVEHVGPHVDGTCKWTAQP